mgnify:CR=1 FL=1
MTEKSGIAVAGKLIFDYVISDTGQVTSRLMGGNGTFAAISAATGGHSVSLLSCQGDGYPSEWLKQLKDASVDCNHLIKLSRPHNFFSVLIYQADGSRRAPTEEDCVRIQALKEYITDNRGWKDAMEDLQQFTFFPDPYQFEEAFIQELDSILICTAKAVQQKEWVQRLKTVNPNLFIIMDGPVEGGRNAIPQGFTDILRYVDCFLPSEVEVKALFPDAPLTEAIERLCSFGPKYVAIKQGARGSLLYEKDTGRLFEVPIFPVKPVDPTGAGDTFCGGVLAGWADKKDICEAVINGNALASVAVSSCGADQLFQGIKETELNTRRKYIRQRIKRL